MRLANRRRTSLARSAPRRAGSPRTGAAAASRRSATRRQLPFAVLVLGLVLGGLCTLLALNTASAANELRRHDLSQKDQQLAAQVEELNNAVQASEAPGALARAAQQLGMVPANAPAFIDIGADGKARVLGSPGPATAPPLPAAPPAAMPTQPAPVTPSPTTPSSTKPQPAPSSSAKTAPANSTPAKGSPAPTQSSTPPSAPRTAQSSLPGGPR